MLRFLQAGGESAWDRVMVRVVVLPLGGRVFNGLVTAGKLSYGWLRQRLSVVGWSKRGQKRHRGFRPALGHRIAAGHLTHASRPVPPPL